MDTSSEADGESRRKRARLADGDVGVPRSDGDVGVPRSRDASHAEEGNPARRPVGSLMAEKKTKIMTKSGISCVSSNKCKVWEAFQKRQK